MKKVFNIVSIVVTVIVLVLIAGYLTVRFMPEKSVSKKDTDFNITASDFAKEFEDNPSASDIKYIDRIIETTGIIAEISKDQNNCTVFILRDNETDTGVLCTLTEDSNKNAKRYKKGDAVKIKGTCSGMIFEVVLNKCIIIE